MKRCVEHNTIVKNPVEAGILDRVESRFNLMMMEGVLSSILDKKMWDAEDEGYSGAYLYTKVKIGISLKDFSLVGVKLKGWIVVKFTVVDYGGLDRVVIWVESGGERVIYLGGNKSAEIEEEFKIGDLLRLIYGGFDVRVNATDLGGNWATGKTHIDSALETLKKGLMALFEIFKEVARVLAKVASLLLDALKKIIMNMLEPVIIKDAIEGYVVDIGKALAIAWDEYQSTGVISGAAAGKVADAVFGSSFVLVLTVVLTVIDVVSKLISPFSIGIVAVAGLIQSIIVSALSAGAAEGSIIDSLLDVGTDIGKIWDIIATYFGITGAVCALISGLLATESFITTIKHFFTLLGALQVASVVLVGAMIGMILACSSFVVENYPQIFGEYYKSIVVVVAFLGYAVSAFSAVLSIKVLGTDYAQGLLSKVAAVISSIGLLVSAGATLNAFLQLEGS